MFRLINHRRPFFFVVFSCLLFLSYLAPSLCLVHTLSLCCFLSVRCFLSVYCFHFFVVFFVFQSMTMLSACLNGESWLVRLESWRARMVGPEGDSASLCCFLLPCPYHLCARVSTALYTSSPFGSYLFKKRATLCAYMAVLSALCSLCTHKGIVCPVVFRSFSALFSICSFVLFSYLLSGTSFTYSVCVLTAFCICTASFCACPFCLCVHVHCVLGMAIIVSHHSHRKAVWFCALFLCSLVFSSLPFVYAAVCILKALYCYTNQAYLSVLPDSQPSTRGLCDAHTLLCFIHSLPPFYSFFYVALLHVHVSVQFTSDSQLFPLFGLAFVFFCWRFCSVVHIVSF